MGNQDGKTERQKLALRYLAEELGLGADKISEAEENLLGLFEVLFRIDERQKKRPL